MIYTLTLNPSLDYAFETRGFSPGGVNRIEGGRLSAGGKGINISAVLGSFGIKSVALGFAAGFTGDEILRLFNESQRFSETGAASDFIKMPGVSRINVKAGICGPGERTEFNAAGPEVPPDESELLMKKLDGLSAGDMIVLAGTVPPGAPSYGDILKRLEGKGTTAVTDASGGALLDTLAYRPFLVKPNNRELCETLNVHFTEDRDETAALAGRLIESGAQNALITMAGKGAVFVSGGGFALKCRAPEGKVINPVGAGDSSAAGFIAGWLEGKALSMREDDLKIHAFKTAVAAGSASAFSEGLAQKSDMERIRENIMVTVL
jgi:1-phosphofructokinase